MRLWPRRKPKPRHGIFMMDVYGVGVLNRDYKATAQIEVAERETAGGKSRVTVVSVSGINRNRHRSVRDLMPQWIPTSQVEWL